MYVKWKFKDSGKVSEAMKTNFYYDQIPDMIKILVIALYLSILRLVDLARVRYNKVEMNQKGMRVAFINMKFSSKIQIGKGQIWCLYDLVVNMKGLRGFFPIQQSSKHSTREDNHVIDMTLTTYSSFFRYGERTENT